MDMFNVEALESQNAQTTYSIEAEDLIVERLFYHLLGNPLDTPGFYLDLGACDPIRASNTHRLYKRGWHGINIEPNPAAIQKFKAIRPRDITLNMAMGPDGEIGQYFSFDDPLLNGFHTQDVIDHHVSRGYELLSQQSIPFVSVNNLLLSYVPDGQTIDYLNIDVENMEFRILSEWDFSRWRPQVISIEIHGSADILEIADKPVARLLREKGYVFVSRLWHTSIFACMPA